MIDWSNVLINAGLTALYLFLAIVIGLLFMGISRKVTARIQNRVGPPIYQNFLDVGKLLSKKSNIKHNWIFDFAPLFALAGVLLALAYLPMGGYRLLSGQGDLIFLLYIMVIPTLGFALGAGASSNPNAGVGIMRALTLMLSYEMPFLLVLLSLMIYYNTASLSVLLEKQMHSIWAIAVLPISALAADIALQGMMMEKPFDIPTAPQEIASGPLVEFGGNYLGMLMLYSAGSVVLETSLFVDLFLGGGVVLNPATYGAVAYVVNYVVWFILIFVVWMIAVFINAVFPRFRIEQAFKFYWKWPTIIAAIGLVQAYIMSVFLGVAP
ncbi:NADH dehydrogenase FAD-containing subunit [Euryarchaeota archaeon ex4484_178]|nr:MAG: NADH dehydrogenase FAD-containing subunit [Euryarchaeota archaeon ex4484_178]